MSKVLTVHQVRCEDAQHAQLRTKRSMRRLGLATAFLSLIAIDSRMTGIGASDAAAPRTDVMITVETFDPSDIPLAAFGD